MCMHTVGLHDIAVSIMTVGIVRSSRVDKTHHPWEGMGVTGIFIARGYTATAPPRIAESVSVLLAHEVHEVSLRSLIVGGSLRYAC